MPKIELVTLGCESSRASAEDPSFREATITVATDSDASPAGFVVRVSVN